MTTKNLSSMWSDVMGLWACKAACTCTFLQSQNVKRSAGNTAKFQSLFAAYGQQERNANANARDSCRLKVFPAHSRGTVLQNSMVSLLLKAKSSGCQTNK